MRNGLKWAFEVKRALRLDRKKTLQNTRTPDCGTNCRCPTPKKDSPKQTHTLQWNELSLSPMLMSLSALCSTKKRLPKAHTHTYTHTHLTVKRIVIVPHADKSVCFLPANKQAQ